MKDLKNPGRRNIRFLLQILVIILLATAAIAATAHSPQASRPSTSATLKH